MKTAISHGVEPTRIHLAAPNGIYQVFIFILNVSSPVLSSSFHRKGSESWRIAGRHRGALHCCRLIYFPWEELQRVDIGLQIHLCKEQRKKSLTPQK